MRFCKNGRSLSKTRRRTLNSFVVVLLPTLTAGGVFFFILGTIVTHAWVAFVPNRITFAPKTSGTSSQVLPEDTYTQPALLLTTANLCGNPLVATNLDARVTSK